MTFKIVAAGRPSSSAHGYHPRHSAAGIAWTALTAAVMFALAAGTARTGRALDNPVLRTEGRVTTIDGILAAAVLIGLLLNVALGGGGPTRPPGTCWFTTRRARPATSSGRRDPHNVRMIGRSRTVRVSTCRVRGWRGGGFELEGGVLDVEVAGEAFLEPVEQAGRDRW